MAQIICDFTKCIYNASTVCAREKLYISEGYCMCSVDGPSTGEVIEADQEESIKLVYPEGIED